MRRFSIRTPSLGRSSNSVPGIWCWTFPTKSRLASPQLAFCASAVLPAAWPNLKWRWARRPLARRWRIFTPQVQRDASPERHLSGLTMQFLARFPVLDIPDEIKIGDFPSYFVLRGRSASPDWEENRDHEVRECCVFCVFSSALPSMQVLLMSCQRIQRDFKYVQPHSPSDARFDSFLCFPALPGLCSCASHLFVQTITMRPRPLPIALVCLSSRLSPFPLPAFVVQVSRALFFILFVASQFSLTLALLACGTPLVAMKRKRVCVCVCAK